MLYAQEKECELHRSDCFLIVSDKGDSFELEVDIKFDTTLLMKTERQSLWW